MANNDDVQFSTTVTTGNSETGAYTSKTKTPIANPDKRTEKQKAKDKRAEYLGRLGVYQRFLTENPALKDLVKRAIADYKNGGEWSQERFNAEYSNTEFAKSRQKAEEEYDLAMGGPNADTYIKKVDDATATIMQQAGRLGIAVDEATARKQATNMVRSNLPQTSLDGWWATQYGALTSDQNAQVTGGGGAVTGTAAEIQQQLMSMAADYGLRMDAGSLREKTGMALGQGERWQEWLQGQEAEFKQHAKSLFPGAANLLDQYTLKQIADPYFNDAADLLGVPTEQMQLSDTKWTQFLAGPNGPMSRDEWSRVLKTDKQYGYDSTVKARQEYTSLGDDLLAAFGKA